jgi:hypothetical protein
MGACSADPDTAGSSDTAKGGSPAATEPTATVFDPDEPPLPGGVRVLSPAVDDFVPVNAGRYGVRVSESLLYAVDVPDDSLVAQGIYLNPLSRGEGGPNGILWIDEAGDDTALPVNPCHDHTPRPVGDTVEDLATALSSQPFLTVTKPVPVTVGGMKGLLVKATVPRDAALLACQDESVDLISDHHSAGAGTVERMWILDVEGARHVVHAKVAAGAYDTNANQHSRAMTRMVDSITFIHG